MSPSSYPSSSLLAEYALARPGASLIRTDARNFRDERSIGYEIGIQQPRADVRFANVFIARLQLLREGADPVNASDDDFEELRLADAGAWRAALRRAVEDALLRGPPR